MCTDSIICVYKYFQQCVSRYYTSGQPHHMPLPAVAAFPGILNIFPATNICKIFATNICHRSGFTPKFCTKCLKKLKNSWGSSKHFNISNHSPFILSSPWTLKPFPDIIWVILTFSFPWFFWCVQKNGCCLVQKHCFKPFSVGQNFHTCLRSRPMGPAPLQSAWP